MIVVEGDVAPGFERVRDVFGDNFEGHGDVGAAVCVYRHGRKVVDLWGGLADAGTGRPWKRHAAAGVLGHQGRHIRQDLNDNRAGLLVQAVRACLG